MSSRMSSELHLDSCEGLFERRHRDEVAALRTAAGDERPNFVLFFNVTEELERIVDKDNLRLREGVRLRHDVRVHDLD